MKKKSLIFTPQDIANSIWQASVALGKEGERIESDDLIQKKADAMGGYDKAIGITTAELKVKGEPITIINSMAKGGASDLLIVKVVAEETLKAHYSKIERLMAMLNGLQTLSKLVNNVPQE
jgi:hypothetical protein